MNTYLVVSVEYYSETGVIHQNLNTIKAESKLEAYNKAIQNWRNLGYPAEGWSLDVMVYELDQLVPMREHW